MRRCHRHEFDEAEDRCRSCGYDYCGACVVYINGPSRPAMCIPCALSRSGVRSAAAPPKRRSRREQLATESLPAEPALASASMSGKVAVGMVTATVAVLAAPVITHLR